MKGKVTFLSFLRDDTPPVRYRVTTMQKRLKKKLRGLLVSVAGFLKKTFQHLDDNPLFGAWKI